MKKTMLSHIVIKLHSISDKETILQVSRVKQTYVTHRGIKVSSNIRFLIRNQREQHPLINLKGKLLDSLIQQK